MPKNHSSTPSTSANLSRAPAEVEQSQLRIQTLEKALEQTHRNQAKLQKRNQARIEKVQRRNQAVIEKLQQASQEAQEDGSQEALASSVQAAQRELRKNQASMAKLLSQNQAIPVQSEGDNQVTNAKSTTEACVIDNNANGSVPSRNDIVEVQHSADHRVSVNDSNKKRKRNPKQPTRGTKSVKSRRRKNEVPMADSTTKQCVVCMDNNVSHVLVPCGHLCLCHDCASDTSLSRMGMKCPECRTDISQAMKIFGI